MVKRSVKERIKKLGQQIGLPGEVIQRACPEDWDLVFREAGARAWDERYRIHDSDVPELKSLPLIAPGAEIAVVSRSPEGLWYVLVQVRNNGETNEKDKEVGVPGGASDMWGYTPRGETKELVVLEHPELTAYREWKEEVGCILPYDAELLTVVTTTNSYTRFPDSYAMSLYFKSEVPWEYMEHLSRLKGSSEGAIKVVPIAQLRNCRWFPDAEECFEMLIQSYAR